jgi:hypothetical protein
VTSSIPKKIKVGHVTYKVGFVKDLKGSCNEKLYGTMNHESAVIKIAHGMNKDLEQEVVIHEVLHAAMRNHPHNFLSSDQEESIVNHLGMQLMSVFKDNPKLMEYLCQKTKP